jgi:putative transposase
MSPAKKTTAVISGHKGDSYAMNKRIPYSQKMKQEVEEILVKGQGQTMKHPLDAFLRQGARYMIQVALEKEIECFLGRDHYERRGRRRQGWRNGYEAHGFKTPMGVLAVGAPQVRETSEPFSSKLLERLDNDPNDALSRLALGMYVRGMSDRDVEDLWVEAFGRQVLSKSAVSEVSQALIPQFDEWRTRDLSSVSVMYLFLDGIFLALRQGTDEKEGVLAAYGITREGKKVLLHLALGSRESYTDWLSMLQDMVNRGLKAPALVIRDGRPSLKKAVAEMWPAVFQQHCQVHKMRNILSKLPKNALAQIKHLVHQVFHAKSYKQGMELGRELVERFEPLYPSAMECLKKDLSACLTYLNFPVEHAKAIRTTNLIERTFGEARRRTKVIPRFPTEQSGLSLVFAVLIRASQKWHGIQMTPAILEKLDHLRVRGKNGGCSDMGREKNVRQRPNLSVPELPSVREMEQMHENGVLVEVK